MNEHLVLDGKEEKLTPSLSRWVFLFLSVYVFLFCTSSQFPTAPIANLLWEFVVPPFASLIGRHDHISIIESTGSGDTSYNFYQIFLFLLLSAIIATGMLFTISKRSTIEQIEKFIFMLLRYFVICQMLIYGISKVLYLQFQYPSDLQMEKRLGDMSPMGLLWTFMGYSKAYTMFAGWLELAAGILEGLLLWGH